MALNYSSRSALPPVPSLSSLFGDRGIDWELFGAPKDCNCSWRGESGGGGPTRLVGNGADWFYAPRQLPSPPTTPVYDDIVDLLPADPFGMGLAADTTTWTAAIAGWIEDLATTMADSFVYYEYGDFYQSVDNEIECYMSNSGVNAANAATWLPSNCVQNSEAGTSLCSLVTRTPLVDLLCGKEFVPGVLYVEEVEKELLRCGREGEEEPLMGRQGRGTCSSTGDSSKTGSEPHDAMLFALAYLDVSDLISVEGVCKTLRSAVQEDPLLWRHIHIDPPLSKRITDDILLHLTARAQGSLECLSLTECSQVTDIGLRHVLENNPKLSKLSVPACTRLSIGGLVDSLKIFNALGTIRIQHLRVGGLYGITWEHFDELRVLLGVDQKRKLSAHKPRFYHRRRASTCDDGATIDVEACPRCQNVRIIYDCPEDSCQAEGSELCRACSICIGRCNWCGRCIHNHEYEETFSLEWICLDCMNETFSCQQMNSDVKAANASMVVSRVG